jgi:hypothetical protein
MSEPIIFKNPERVNLSHRAITVEMDIEDDRFDFQEDLDGFDVEIRITKKVKPFEPGYYRYTGAVDRVADPGRPARTISWFTSPPWSIDGFVDVEGDWEAVEVSAK